MNDIDFAVTTARLFDAGIGLAGINLDAYVEHANGLDRADLVDLAVGAAHLQRAAVNQLAGAHRTAYVAMLAGELPADPAEGCEPYDPDGKKVP